MLRGTTNSQFNRFSRKKPVPKQGENKQEAANSENQIVSEIETTTLDITGAAGELVHSQDQNITMFTPDGTGIKLEQSKIEEVKRTGSVRRTEELDAIVQSRTGSMGHIKKKLTEHKGSDGSFSSVLETEIDRIPSEGNEQHTKVKHSIVITPSGNKTELHSVTLFAAPVKQRHVLDLLEVGKSYNIDNFIGTVPGLHSFMLTGFSLAEPVWKHTSCTLSVESGDKSGKCLVIEAEVDAKNSNITYGVTGKYKVGVNLQKQGNGVICTEIKGLSGDISVPGPLYYPVSLFSSDSFNLAAYGAGSSDEPLALPVLLTDNKDGTFNLNIEVDGSKLNLTGVSYLMHTLLEKSGYSKPSQLQGKINIGQTLTHANAVKQEKRSEGRDEKEKRNEADDIEQAKANSIQDLTLLEQAQHAVVQQTEENLVQAAQYKSFK